MLEAITEDELARIIASMIEAAVGGDVQAARLLLDRCLGSTDAIDVIVRVEELEERLGELEGGAG